MQLHCICAARGANLIAYLTQLCCITASMLTPTLTGRLSDSYGRRRMLLLSQVGSMTSFGLYVVYPSIPTLFISNIVHGLTQCTFAMGLSMVADRSASYSGSSSSTSHKSKEPLLPMAHPKSPTTADGMQAGIRQYVRV
jgi:MFS family permease